MYSCILLATDGNPGALGAVRLAGEIAALHNARIEVVAVHDPSPMVSGIDDAYFPAFDSHDDECASALRERVTAQLEQVWGSGRPQNVTVKSGPVAPMIARAASHLRAGLIVMGLREYAPGEHWIRRETLLRVMNLAQVPVLAVPRSAHGLPRTALLATDLGPLSLAAAREARGLFAADASLHLVHALPPDPVPADAMLSDWRACYRYGVELRMNHIEEELTRNTARRGQIHLLSGDPGEVILRVASDSAAELIAVGSHANSPFERLMLGVIATHVVRGSECSVLVVPSPRVSSDLRRNLIETEVLAHLTDVRIASPV